MDTIKPIKIYAKRATRGMESEILTSAELGKLWATYMGNSMSRCVLNYFLQHCDDPDIKKIVENSLRLSEEFIKKIEEIFNHDGVPIPYGFTDDDVNLGAPRLFFDEFYLHYLKYAGKAGIDLYAIGLPLMTRLDVRDLLTYVIDSTVKLLNQVNELLINKGLFVKTPNIPIPAKVEFVREASYLNGFFGNIRPLHALEIAHLFDNIENHATSKALIIGFSQVAKSDEVRQYFNKAKSMTVNHIETCAEFLHKEDLPSPSLLDNLVTTSTIAPFSDKLMLFHKIDMFAMRIRSYGNSSSLNGRHNLGLMYARLLLDISLFVDQGGKLFIEQGWMEQPPIAANRNNSTSNRKGFN